MDANKIINIIEQSDEFSIVEYKNQHSSIINNQKDKELINKILFLQSELNETKNNYEKLFKDFLLYKQKCEELLQKQNQYFLQENQQQNDLKDQIKDLQIKNEQIIQENKDQENKELLKIKNENLELLKQLNNEKYLSQKLYAEIDQLLDSNKNKTNLIEQYINKNQDYEKNNQDLIQQIKELVIELEKNKKENYLLEQQIISYNQQGINVHLVDIAKLIIEELKQIESQYQKEGQQIVQRKQLAYNLFKIFNENLRKPLQSYDMTFRHDFNDNKILGQEEIKKSQNN